MCQAIHLKHTTLVVVNLLFKVAHQTESPGHNREPFSITRGTPRGGGSRCPPKIFFPKNHDD